MNGHRCIHCNEMSPEHLALCVTNRYGKPGEDYHTGPPDYVVPPVLDEDAEALREREEEIDRLRADNARLDDLAATVLAQAADLARLRAAVREYLAADGYAAEHDVDDADAGRCTFAEFSSGLDRLKAARATLDALTTSEVGDRG